MISYKIVLVGSFALVGFKVAAGNFSIKKKDFYIYFCKMPLCRESIS